MMSAFSSRELGWIRGKSIALYRNISGEATVVDDDEDDWLRA
jgi:hypothetical protein